VAREGVSAARVLTADTYDGLRAATLAKQLRVPAALVYARLGSTMDAAHAGASAGAPAGTLFLANEQTAGRGRQGRAWRSAPGRGIWLTLVERPVDTSSLQVLSLRVGLALADALDPFAPAPVKVKWPNDLYTSGGKLAGVLIEARWSGDRLDWVAVGVGINVAPPPDTPNAGGLRAGATRLAVLRDLVPAVRAAASRTGALDAAELAAFAYRDYARGRRCAGPAPGVVCGITATGELVIKTSSGVGRVRTGSLVLEERP
jgi:BirA family biotin operon repressor/biotin-[acetyl-CoA-carboxylase] ligase